jgi:hypothetical protein
LEKAEHAFNRGAKEKLQLKVEIQRLKADHSNWDTEERREQIEKARRLLAFQWDWHCKKKKLLDEIDNAQAEFRLFEMRDQAMEEVQSQIDALEQEFVDARAAFEHECAEIARDAEALEKVHGDMLRGIEAEVKEARAAALRREKAETEAALKLPAGNQNAAATRLKKELDSLNQQLSKQLKAQNSEDAVRCLTQREHSQIEVLKANLEREIGETKQQASDYHSTLSLACTQALRAVRAEKEKAHRQFFSQRTRLEERVSNRELEIAEIEEEVRSKESILIDVVDVAESVRGRQEAADPNGPRAAEKAEIRRSMGVADRFIKKANWIIQQMACRLTRATQRALEEVEVPVRRSSSFGNVRDGLGIDEIETGCQLEEEEIVEEDEFEADAGGTGKVRRRKRSVRWVNIKGKKRTRRFGPGRSKIGRAHV